MVFFGCDGCGEMLKKNQVDNHANRCRRCVSVSCLDCSVSFPGDDYRVHTSCISEKEKYEKTDYQGHKGKKKASPQEQWMDLIQRSIPSAPASLKHHLGTISSLDNVPRKEKQFRNFASNSLGLRGKSGEDVVGGIWTYLKGIRETEQTAAAAKRAAEKEESSSTLTEDKEEITQQQADGSHKSSSKRKEINEANENDSGSKPSTKTVKKAMKKVLKKSANKSLKLKELSSLVAKKLGVPDASKDKVKVLIKENLGSSASEGKKKSSFILSGKIVTLSVN